MRPSFRIPTESWVTYAVVVVLCAFQRFGQVTADTRLELAERPGSFLAGSLQLWHPEANFGEIQNQAYGYLFPQGAWFTFWDWVGMPTWVSQRLWMALVLILALEGTRRVARTVGLGRGAAFLAGLAFALAPRFLSTLGVLSAETLPGAVLPWVLLPVLLTLRGWMRPWRGAVLSAAAVVGMGGVNAVEVLGSLPLPLIVVVWGACVGLVAWRFVAQWCGMVALAGLWWLLPLLVMGKFAPAFYAWVESSAVTTGVIGPSRALRGATHWVGLLRTGGEPWWPAADELNFTSHLVIVAAVVQVLGLVGLVVWRNRLRTPFLLAVLVAFAALTVSHGTWSGSPVADTMRTLLDGPIQMFRNVHKIDPTLRLPVAIGFGFLAARLVHVTLTRLRARAPRRFATALGEYGWLAFGVPVLLVAVLGQPLLTSDTRTQGWDSTDAAWQGAHDFLVAEQGRTRTLVLPGSGFAQQEWGWTLEEPLLAWDDVNFATRSMVPFVPGSSIRFLTALNNAVADGSASADLVQVLRRAGVGHLLVRRDLDREATGSPDPRGAARSADNMDLEQVASFGPDMQGGQQIEIYAVPGASSATTATDAQDVLTVSGSVEGVVDLRDAGLVSGQTPVVLAGEQGWKATPDIVTDTNTRRERAFGSVGDNLSSVLQADEPYRVDRTVHDYPGSPSPEVVASYEGVRLVSASSSVSYADTWGIIDPTSGPFAVLDRDARTRWISSPGEPSERQWLRIDFDKPRPVGKVTVASVIGDASLGQPRQLRVSVGERAQLVSVDPTGSPSVVDFAGQRADHVLVEFTRVSGALGAQVAISDVSVEDLDPVRSLVVPGRVGENAQVMLSTAAGSPSCQPGADTALCEETRATPPAELSGMRRTVTWAQDTPQVLQGQVQARATSWTQSLLESTGRGQLTTSSSVLGEDVLAASVLATDGDPATAWRPSTADQRPTFSVLWSRPHTIEGIELRYSPDSTTTPFVEVLVDGKPRKGYFVGNTFRFHRPWRGQEFTLRFNRTNQGQFGVAEVTALGHDMTRPLRTEAPIARPCGRGPRIVVDGVELATRIDGTIGDLMSGRPLDFQVCGQVDEDTVTTGGQDLQYRPVSAEAAALTTQTPALGRDGKERPAARNTLDPDERLVLTLDAGQHTVQAQASPEFAVTRLVLTPADLTRHAPHERSVETRASSRTSARLSVAPGAAAVLVAPHNHNIGWEARTPDGKPLTAIRVDGWMQAWLLPAADVPLEVQVEFVAEKSYAIAMTASVATAGGVLTLGLLALVWPRLQRRRARRRGESLARPENPGTPGADLAGEPRWRLPAALALVAALSVLVGPVAGAGAVLGWWGRRFSVVAVLGVAILCGVGSGVLAIDPWRVSERVPDALAALCLGLLVGVVLRPARRSHSTAQQQLVVLPNWRSAQGVGAAVLLFGTLCWRWVLLREAYYHGDDFVRIADAVGRPFDLSFLFTELQGHVVPAQQAIHWWLGNKAAFDWTFVAVLLLALQAMGLWLVWALLSRLLPGRRVRLVLFALLAASTASLPSSLWLSTGLVVWPQVVALCGAMICLLRLAQGDSHRVLSGIGLLASVAGGLAFTERTLLVLPVLAGTAVLLAPGRGRARIGAALRRWAGWWVLLTALVVAYLVAHARTVSVGAEPWTTAADFIGTWATLLGATVAPGFFSGPWQASVVGQQVQPAVWAAVVGMLALLGLVAWVLRRGGSSARWALVAVLGYSVLDVALIAQGAGGFGVRVALDPRYGFDLVLVMVVFGALVLTTHHRAAEAPTTRAVPDLLRWQTGLLVLAVLASSVVSAHAVLPQVQHPADRDYVGRLTWATASNPAGVLLDRPASAAVVGVDPGSRNRWLSHLFGTLPGAPAFDLPTPGLGVVNADGDVTAFTFEANTVQQVKGEEIREDTDEESTRHRQRRQPKVLRSLSCWATLGPGESLTWRPEEPAAKAQALQIGYRTDKAWDVRVRAGGSDQVFRTSGWGQVFLPMGERDVDSVRLVTPADYDGSLCVVLMRVGRTDVPIG